MIKVISMTCPSPEQWNAVIVGMRNPMNSWGDCDSRVCDESAQLDDEYCKLCVYEDEDGWLPCNYLPMSSVFVIGEKDFNLAKRLVNAGVEHAKFLRQLPVTIVLEAPLYWWKQMDQYKVGTTTNSCSTMHKLTDREFVPNDFSLGELGDDDYYIESGSVAVELNIYVGEMFKNLNALRDRYLETKDMRFWHAINRLLPQSYNQIRTWSGSYATLFNICAQRAGHKLEEWNSFITYVFENVPYFYELCYNKLCEINPRIKELVNEH